MTANLKPCQIKALAAVRTRLIDEAERLRELADHADQPPSDMDSIILKTLRKFAAVHASSRNHFNLDRYLTRRSVFKQDRSAAMVEWHQLAA